MNKKTRSLREKKVIAVELAILLLASGTLAYIYLEKISDDNSKARGTKLLKEYSEEELVDPTFEKVTELIQQLDESMMRGYIEKITSFGPHVTEHRLLTKLLDLPIEKVRRYLVDEFESMGLEVRTQYWEQEPTLANLRVPKYYFGWCVGKNVEATLSGTDKDSNEIYVVVAHYDTMPRAPGADDDTSGVAAVLCAAKLMSRYSFNHTVRFLLVDGEEQGLMGSFAYAEESAKKNENIVATICLDMIGNRGPGYRGTEIFVGTNDQTSWIYDFIVDVNQRYVELLDITIFEDDAMAHGSDHKSFIKNGLDSVLIEEAVFDKEDWHQPTDTLENTDVPHATHVSKLVLATLAEFAWDVDVK